jgi:hypothetical protein
MTTLPALPDAPKRPIDPARIGYPPTLPIEIVLRTASFKEIREAYGFTPEEWATLREDPVFLADLARVKTEVQKEGVSFKLKARLQSDQLLTSAWNIIHDTTGATPPSVKADMIKAIWRVAGHEPTKGDAAAANTNAFQINIQFSGEKP